MRKPRAVLDTNAVLDWLAFRDARCEPLRQALEGGALCWLATEAMRSELIGVAERLALVRQTPWLDLVVAGWAQWAQTVPVPAPLGAASGLRCTDPADQMYIDLAVSEQAQWLVTHDRALLRLARRASALGVRIVTPPAWPGTPR